MTHTTHTYAILEVSAAAYMEISKKLSEAGYNHVFGEDDGAQVIDMHGIALKHEPSVYSVVSAAPAQAATLAPQLAAGDTISVSGFEPTA